MRDMLDEKLRRFEELERLLTDPEVLADGNRIAAIAREHGSLARQATKYRRFKQLVSDLVEAKELAESDDPEIAELAADDIPRLREERERIWDELLDMTIGGEDANRTRCVMEIRAGTGGEEAALFAGDLFGMYRRYAELRGWKVEIISQSMSDMGGFKEIVLALRGEYMYRDLAYESVGHRVQRVPETESKGRVHTSHATVAVMPAPEDVEVELKPDDYIVEKKGASGPGGQHVNKTESAIRLTHIETGIVVSMQDEKSQHKNLSKALRILKSRVYEHFRQLEADRRSSERRSLVGSGDRSERIRTYNFPENRCTDHRINLSLYKLDQIMAGEMQVLTDALIDHDRTALRTSMGAID